MVTEIYIGSTNTAKIQAVQLVFPHSKIVPVEVPSNVSAQPLSDQETRVGAINRAKYIVEKYEANVAIGLEGGVFEENAEMLLCNWGALATKEGDLFTAGGARIPLPDDIAKAIHKGYELGDVIDQWTSRTDVKKQEGTIGILTSGMITRTSMFEHVVFLLVGQLKFSQKMKRG